MSACRRHVLLSTEILCETLPKIQETEDVAEARLTKGGHALGTLESIVTEVLDEMHLVLDPVRMSEDAAIPTSAMHAPLLLVLEDNRGPRLQCRLHPDMPNVKEAGMIATVICLHDAVKVAHALQ